MIDRKIGTNYLYYIEQGANQPASAVMGYSGTITCIGCTFWNTGQYYFDRRTFSPTGIEL